MSYHHHMNVTAFSRVLKEFRDEFNPREVLIHNAGPPLNSSGLGTVPAAGPLRAHEIVYLASPHLDISRFGLDDGSLDFMGREFVRLEIEKEEILRLVDECGPDTDWRERAEFSFPIALDPMGPTLPPKSHWRIVDFLRSRGSGMSCVPDLTYGRHDTELFFSLHTRDPFDINFHAIRAQTRGVKTCILTDAVHELCVEPGHIAKVLDSVDSGLLTVTNLFAYRRHRGMSDVYCGIPRAGRNMPDWVRPGGRGYLLIA